MTKKLLLNETARKWLKVEGARSECFPWACKNGQTLSELVKLARPDWALWVLLRPGVLTDRELWLFACWCAEQSLPRWYAVYPDDHRPRQAIEARRGWLDGKVTDKELGSARSAARLAARSAAWSAAEAAARSAWLAEAARSADAAAAAVAAARSADAAAWSAAWSAQVRWILENCNPQFADSQEVSE